MSKKTAKLMMMRHGQSEWNKLNLFTGWVDIPLSEEGVRESIEGGKKIADLPVDVVFTSTLIRAHTTATLAMLQHKSKKILRFLHPHEGKKETWSAIYSEKVEKECIPVHTAWELNERMYGKLQGMNKAEMKEKYGEAQVQRWRRSFDEAPPEGESLSMTAKRTIPYFEQKILPLLNEGKNVFIFAHGNSLRSIVMFLDKLTKEQVVGLELATGAPLVYSFHGDTWSRDGG